MNQDYYNYPPFQPPIIYTDVSGFTWHPEAPAAQHHPEPSIYVPQQFSQPYPDPTPRMPFAPITAPVVNASTAPKAPAAPKALKEPKKSTRGAGAYTAQQLLDIVLCAVSLDFFMAKFGEKGAKEKQFGEMVRERGIQGSDGQLKSRLLELLAYHEDPESAPAAILQTIENTPQEVMLGAPLDLLISQRRQRPSPSSARPLTPRVPSKLNF
ncbi:hypothetical protein B0H16DRAFT_173294 [Mycena metata]|uniref:Uncharacterized protein n=1 Tax=Mycena metata TaxID=1033252 RepID=A0AAD7MU83_9AGAR|nr:hypothetical protein B0H16DRAFT_173294 [Mycena metata]